MLPHKLKMLISVEKPHNPSRTNGYTEVTLKKISVTSIERKFTMLEKQIELRLKQKSEEVGAYCLKFTSPGTRGVPDRIIISDKGVFFVELKRPKGGVISPSQRKWMRRFKRLGQKIYVLKTKEEVDDFVQRYLA